MTKTVRARYTLAFKQKAVRLVRAGQSIAAAARTLGVVEQTLFNWVKAHRHRRGVGDDRPAPHQREVRWLPERCRGRPASGPRDSRHL